MGPQLAEEVLYGHQTTQVERALLTKHGLLAATTLLRAIGNQALARTRPSLDLDLHNGPISSLVDRTPWPSG